LNEDDREDFQMALQVVISRTDQLNNFMRSFADVVRLPEPHMRPCDVQQLLEEIALLMRAECESHNIKWRWQIETELAKISMDRVQMEQALVNIVKNALEAIGQDGEITIRIGEQKHRAFITIEDSGGGINSDVRANLFTPFYTTKQNGQGLGLTIVREILERHHFDYSLEGGPGQPTQFTIYF
jgi:two-component system, NtrC family, nitrogen regulation sensor histidine kinase NtrY